MRQQRLEKYSAGALDGRHSLRLDELILVRGERGGWAFPHPHQHELAERLTQNRAILNDIAATLRADRQRRDPLPTVLGLNEVAAALLLVEGTLFVGHLIEGEQRGAWRHFAWTVDGGMTETVILPLGTHHVPWVTLFQGSILGTALTNADRMPIIDELIGITHPDLVAQILAND